MTALVIVAAVLLLVGGFVVVACVVSAREDARRVRETLLATEGDPTIHNRERVP